MLVQLRCVESGAQRAMNGSVRKRLRQMGWLEMGTAAWGDEISMITISFEVHLAHGREVDMNEP